MMKRRLIALALGNLLAVASVTSAFAVQPPGQQDGYAPGLRGYEGQPGTQADSR